MLTENNRLEIKREKTHYADKLQIVLANRGRDDN